MVYMSLLALTRGVLYAIPTSERVPRGLDLMPRGWLSVYGILWLWAALYGLFQAAKQTRERRARWFLAVMFMTWASAYSAASFFPDGNRFSLMITAFFFAMLGGICFACKTRIVVKYQPIFIVHGADNEAGFEMIDHSDLEQPGPEVGEHAG